MLCRKLEAFPIINRQEAERGLAKVHRLFQQSLEYRRNGTGRRVNDLENFPRRRQLLTRFVQLAPQTSALIL